MTCALCDGHRFDSYFADVGNNAETRVVVDLCEPHWNEMEKDPDAFDEKHREKVEALAVRQ